MYGIVGLLRWYGTHNFLLMVCFLDLCFLAYDLGVRQQKMSTSVEVMLQQTEEAQLETELLVMENLNLYRKFILEKTQEREKIKKLTEQIDNIETLIQQLKRGKKDKI